MIQQSFPILAGKRSLVNKPLFRGIDCVRRILRRRISVTSPRLSAAFEEFLNDGQCVAIMEGQPWASLSKQPQNSSRAKNMFVERTISNLAYSKQNFWDFESPLSREKNYILRFKGLTTTSIGGAGIGLLLEDPATNQTVWSARIYVSGDRSPIEAEYSAIILGMDYVTKILKLRRLTVLSCNDIIVNQLQGIFTSTSSSMEILLQTLKSIQQELVEFAVSEISPTDNSEAATQAMKALATRKSLNIIDDHWNVEQKDPIQKLHRNPLKMGRWKEPDNPAQSTAIDPTRLYRLQFDGGAARELVGAGMVLYDDDGTEIWCGWHYHPTAATNNIAEYMGLICGLRCALSLGIKKLIVEGDSLLVVQQMTSEYQYQTRERDIEMFRKEAHSLIQCFSDFEIRYIPRAENKRADWLANHAMSLQESDGFATISNN